MEEKAGALGAPPPYAASLGQPGQPEPAWQDPAAPPPPVIAQPGQTTVMVQQPPPVPQPQSVVVTTATMPMRMSQFPANVQCPNCRNTVTTNTHQENGTLVWLTALILLLIGLWLGCCLIPFCIPALKDTIHTCPICQFTIGKHTQI
ncbi:lipopolysaccharide-induced tumor necrosis factor-alpha factor homolog [Acanthaster planci]|uniref:Lipopolysaccharide-induced tumor necrosis factor-alpha factor homolog n=1 Tax=Acanthaster planci TaxID=133434 RepID=A0A8B7YGX5_ACAPL|nr:lipopolysaccharide-induced tumor necrosis factor-alpha factor homolog [Acanthaster planci]XP_022092490.1 lipopolysaccharide-induced tumor necrosis factor-alpha factor homolog [Acanthaster planci]